MWAVFAKGGFMMIPLAFCSIVGAAIIIEKLLTLRASRVIQRDVVNTIDSLRTMSDIPMAIKICERSNSPFANVIRAGLEEAEESMTIIRQVMEDTGRREIKRLGRYLVLLESVAVASPLLGLLGTVLGMMDVFRVISVEGMGQAGLLSGGIAQALITTAFGLFIGIPALIAFNLLDKKVDTMVVKIDEQAHLLLKRLSHMKPGSHEFQGTELGAN